MKKIHFVGVIAFVMGLSTILAGSSINLAAAEPDWTWAHSPGPQTVSIRPHYTTSSRCTDTTETETVMVSGVGQVSACIQVAGTATGMRFGTYGDAVYTSPIISFAGETAFYQLTGFAAYRTDYAGAADTLLVEYDQYPGAGLLTYQHIKNHLRKVEQSGVISYTLDEQPIHPLVQSSLKTWYVHSIAISNNGRFVALELMGDGIGVLDTKTMIVKRISSHGYSYGLGADPTVQMAITNDGSFVVAVGMNAGIKALVNTTNCGDYALYDDPPVTPAPPQPECPDVASQLISLLPPGFIDASEPHFSADDGQLSIVSRDHHSMRGVVIDAAGYHRAPLDYLALGDSFSSGEGETSDAFYESGTNDPHEKCHVSTRSYPFLLAQTLAIDLMGVKSVACSGATMNDVIGNDDSYWGQSKRLGSGGENFSDSARQAAQTSALESFSPGKVHQISFVARYTPHLVTIGIGGNDAGLFSKLQACVMPDSCEWVSSAGKAEVEREIQALFPKFVDTYTKIRQASTDSAVAVVEYPQVINPDGHCDTMLSSLLNHDERQLIAESIHYLNQVIVAAAQRAGVSVLDTEHSFAGQELCGLDGQLAMNAIRTGDDFAPLPQLDSIITLGNETFHPTPYGHTLLAQTLSTTGDIEQSCSTYGCTADLSVTAPTPDSAYWPITADGLSDVTQAISGEFLPKTIIPMIDEELKIATDRHAFAPGSSVVVSVHSIDQTLATVTANDNGDISTDVSLPADLEPGYHTIHLKGQSMSGEAIDMYQTFLYDPSEASPAESPGTSIIDQITAIAKKLPALIEHMINHNAATSSNESTTEPGSNPSPDQQNSSTADPDPDVAATDEAVKGAHTVESRVNALTEWWPVAAIIAIGVGIGIGGIWWIARDPRRR